MIDISTSGPLGEASVQEKENSEISVGVWGGVGCKHFA